MDLTATPRSPTSRPRGPVERRRRSTARSCWASATTCARTGSARWCWGCRAASTRRSTARSPSTRSAPMPCAALAMPSPFSSPGEPRGRGGRAPGALGIRIDTVPITRVFDAYRHSLAELFAGTRRGRHRGEPAGAHPRQPADGAVEQVRLDRAGDRQQERVRGRATRRCTATWRAGSRRSRTCRRRWCTSWPGWRNAAGRGETPPIPERTIDEAAERRAAAGPEGHRLAAALRRARPDHRGLRRGRHGRRRHGRAAGSTARSSSASCA